MLLSLDRVAKFYGPKLVFKKISLELDAGEILLLAGPNGAGKSTLLKVMAGLARPASGAVKRATPDERMGFLGHQTFIYPELTGLENLRFWAGIHKLRLNEQQLLAALDRMELKKAAQERAGRYSRGMAQRLNLARVFLHDPELILLDEPGTGLDVRSAGVLRREITAARDRGAGLVWISHHLEDDLAIADRVLAIKDKTPVFLGPAREFDPATLREESL